MRGVGLVAVGVGAHARVGLAAPGTCRRARSCRRRRSWCRCGSDERPRSPDDSAGCAVQVLRVTGGARLDGEVAVVGAKNSVLKLMAAALLAPGEHDARQPAGDLGRRHHARSCSNGSGCEVTESRARRAPTRSPSRVPDEPLREAPYELVRKIRGSICVLGPLLARTGRAKVALPGGDAIGSRPLDMHFAGLERHGRRDPRRARLHRRRGARAARRARSGSTSRASARPRTS